MIFFIFSLVLFLCNICFWVQVSCGFDPSATFCLSGCLFISHSPAIVLALGLSIFFTFDWSSFSTVILNEILPFQNWTLLHTWNLSASLSLKLWECWLEHIPYLSWILPYSNWYYESQFDDQVGHNIWFDSWTGRGCCNLWKILTSRPGSCLSTYFTITDLDLQACFLEGPASFFSLNFCSYLGPLFFRLLWVVEINTIFIDNPNGLESTVISIFFANFSLSSSNAF